jgi:DMSO/TMAO reductase YedYZ molybdopterin-dependent catalytic subunit
VRLVVPGWYGVASVKWLVGARAVHAPFDGVFQTGEYVYRAGDPVTTLRVKSVFTEPAPGVLLAAGVPVRVGGWAWSAEPVVRVDVSTDGGATWRAARLGTCRGHGWLGWRATWTPPCAGTFVLLARAFDAGGARQPLTVPWNAFGYGNNVTSRTRVCVR